MNDEVFEEEDEIEMNPRHSRFVALLADDSLMRERSSSPMIESDTSTEAEAEEENKGSAGEQKATKHEIKMNRNRKWKKKRSKKRKEGARTGQQDLDEFILELDRKKELKKKKQWNESSSGKIQNKKSNKLEAYVDFPNAIDQLFAIDSSILLDQFEVQEASNLQQNRFIKINPMGKIVKHHENWPEARHLGFQMIVDEVRGQIKWFRFWHKESYQCQQQQFWRSYRLHNYQIIFSDILRHQNPHHLDSLLLMADVFGKQGDENRSEEFRDFIKRGIFACEFFAAHPTFQPISSNHRLEYSIRENRAFFLLLHRQMLNKMEAGRWSAALEFAKLIFSKDPDNDPMAILLLIDSLAFRARCPNFLLDFYQHFSNKKRLDLMPNFRLSLVLIFRMIGQDDEAEKQLEETLIRFPFILCQILDYLQIQVDSTIDRNYYLNTLASFRETESLLQLIRIYLHHSGEFWREPGTLSWLEIATHRLLPKLSARNSEMVEWAKRRKFIFVGLPENIARHCYLHAIPINDMLLEDTKLELGPFPVTDPFPPKNGSQEYSPAVEIDGRNSKLYSRLGKRHYREDNALNEGGRSNFFISFLHSLLPQMVQNLVLLLYQNICKYFFPMRTPPVDTQTVIDDEFANDE